jgi:enoyl-CoA hydratase/carnithine racemase
MEWQTVRFEQDGPHVGTLVLNRPDRRNAINRQMANDLVDALKTLTRQRQLRVLILTGAGTSFSAGGDLKDRLDAGPDEARRQRDLALEAIDLLDRFACPVIAAINGAALAGGFELALACDIRVASDDAIVGLPEARTAGGFPGAGGPVRLSRLIGRGRAGLVVYTARPFSAAEALGFGMLDLVFPADQLSDKANALAAQIAANSPTAVCTAKQLIRQGDDLDIAAATELSRTLRNPLDDMPDAREAVCAWREKRLPSFQDR